MQVDSNPIWLQTVANELSTARRLYAPQRSTAESYYFNRLAGSGFIHSMRGLYNGIKLLEVLELEAPVSASDFKIRGALEFLKRTLQPLGPMDMKLLGLFSELSELVSEARLHSSTGHAIPDAIFDRNAPRHLDYLTSYRAEGDQFVKSLSYLSALSALAIIEEFGEVDSQEQAASLRRKLQLALKRSATLLSPRAHAEFLHEVELRSAYYRAVAEHLSDPISIGSFLARTTVSNYGGVWLDEALGLCRIYIKFSPRPYNEFNSELNRLSRNFGHSTNSALSYLESRRALSLHILELRFTAPHSFAEELLRYMEAHEFDDEPDQHLEELKTELLISIATDEPGLYDEKLVASGALSA